MLTFIVISYLISFVNCIEQLCDSGSVREVGSAKEYANKHEFCNTVPCILRQCAQPYHIMFKSKNAKNASTCLSVEAIWDITKRKFDLAKLYPVYKTNYLLKFEKSNKTIWDFHHAVLDKRMYTTNCSNPWYKPLKRDFMRLLEDGSLLLEFPNDSPRFQRIPKGQFILEFAIRKQRNNTWTDPVMLVKTMKVMSKFHVKIYNSIGMFISCFFFILVLAVYSMFSSLRNLAGMILMAYSSCLTLGFGLKAVQTVMQDFSVIDRKTCKYTTIIMYFALLASFFWMNVMSFDIWRTFRASYKLTSINRRGIMHKFCMYCLYAFGLPSLMTIFAVAIDTADLRNYPGIIKPGFDDCFRSDNAIQYLYMPIMILLCGNVILFLMTSFNIWRINKEMARYFTTEDSSKNKHNQRRFYIYIKLSLINGINWILDFIGAFVDMPPWLEYIINCNVLIGIGIFVIFICKRKILLLLCKRPPKDKRQQRLHRPFKEESVKMTPLIEPGLRDSKAKK